MSNWSHIYTGARVRVYLMAVAVLAGVFLSGLGAPASADAAPVAKRLRWGGSSWFTSGANLPWVAYGCDFGCGTANGVRGNVDQIDRMFRQMDQRGIKTVRWYAFPGTAWQVRRAGDGTPLNVAYPAIQDMDVAVRLARKHDLHLVFVLFSDTRTVPSTWLTDPAQTDRLAEALRPLVRRYAGNRSVLSWELFNEPERGVDEGRASIYQMRRTVGKLARMVNANAPTFASVGPLDVTRISDWTGLGLDFYSPHSFSTMSGIRCGACRPWVSVVRGESADAPVVIGAIDAPNGTSSIRQFGNAYRSGYAGMWSWSWRGAGHPSLGTAKPRMQVAGAWRLMYDQPSVGPRMRVPNPCIGPYVGRYMCPDLQMARPSNIFLSYRGGRALLMSRNSLDNMGRGPASLHGTGSGGFTMGASQRLRTRVGGILTLATKAHLLFKAIPGQGRYWKWNGAARMELWRLDGNGRPAYIERLGPKTVYCLRDLTRTHGYLTGSPGSAVFPACNRSSATRAVTLGTSVGWSDIYPATYHENWVDVTGLRGCFAYVHVADPDNVIYESDEDDNRSLSVVRLPFTGSNSGCPRAGALPVAGAGRGY